MSKNLGKDAEGVQKVVTSGEYFGDAMGQFALNSITILTGQLTYFYTNKVGMAAATAAMILLVSRIVDAVTDLIMGKLVDRTKSKYGKARPWLLWMMIPTALSIITLFTVPKIGNTGMALYGIFSNVFACAICYTAIAVPYYTMIAYKTRSNEEKGKFGTYRSAVGYVVGIAIGIGLLPITNALGGDQRAWIIVSGVFAVISAVCLYVAFKTSKERYAEEDNAHNEEANIGILHALKILIHNSYWVKITLVGVCVNIMYAMIMAAPVYYAQYILGSDNLMGIINVVNIIPSVIGFMTTGMLLKKFGLTGTMKLACGIGILGCSLRAIFPGSLIATLIFGSIVMYATIPLISCLPAMVLNTAEINKQKYDVRITGMTNSSNSFVGKIGNGIGGAAIGWVLAAAGFSAEAPVTSAVTTAIYGINIYIPMVMFIIALVLLLRYDLDKKYIKLVEENNARDAAKENITE